MSHDAPDLRKLLLELLLDSRDFPTRRFGPVMEAAGVEPRDRSLGRQILGGVLRHAVKLDAIYEPYCNRRVTDEAARWALRMGTLQLFFLAQVPEHAAVHSTVQAGRSFLRERTGFVHAVLRSLQRGSKEEQPAQQEFARRRLVVGKRSYWFDRAIFHDPERYPLEHAAQEWSYPRALVARWFEELGPPAAIERMRALAEVPPIWVRVRTQRISREELAEQWRALGVTVELAEHERFLFLPRGAGDVRALPGYQEGHFAVQDLTSFESVELGKPAPGERILDLCAAPGGKSFAALELTEGQAELLACDTVQSRLDRIAPEAERLGHELQTQCVDAESFDYPDVPVDLLILDVPCTNTGVLHKRPEARSRFHKDELHRATTLQNLIRKAVQKAYLAPGKARPRVLWTTCSLEREENEEMAARIAKQANYRLVEERRFEPDGKRAGGYAAILEPQS